MGKKDAAVHFNRDEREVNGSEKATPVPRYRLTVDECSDVEIPTQFSFSWMSTICCEARFAMSSSQRLPSKQI